jgi:hypothetical protein
MDFESWRILIEVFMVWWLYYSGIYLEGLRKIMEIWIDGISGKIRT